MSFRSIERRFPNSFSLFISSYISYYLYETLCLDSPRSAAAAACPPPASPLPPWARAAKLGKSLSVTGQNILRSRGWYWSQIWVSVSDCDWQRIHVSHSKISDLAGPRDTKKVSLQCETTSKGRGCSRGNQTYTEDKVRDLSLVSSWPKPFSLEELKSETSAALTNRWANRNGQSRAHLLYTSVGKKKSNTQIKCYKEKVMRILCFHWDL